jgi:hypothetical protein
MAVVVGGSALTWALNRPSVLAVAAVAAGLLGALWWTRRTPASDGDQADGIPPPDSDSDARGA